MTFRDQKAYNSKYEEGNWTMIYDEGFLIYFKKKEFFAFSKYVMDPENI